MFLSGFQRLASCHMSRESPFDEALEESLHCSLRRRCSFDISPNEAVRFSVKKTKAAKETKISRLMYSMKIAHKLCFPE